MSDSSRKFLVDYSKRVSKCQNSTCKAQMDVGSLRLGKVGPSPFGDGEMKQYYHPKCMFDTFKRARASTKVIESADDIADFSAIKDDDKKAIVKLIKELNESRGNKKTSTDTSKKPSEKGKKSVAGASAKKNESDDENDTDVDEKIDEESDKDDADSKSDDGYKFETFQQICEKIANTSSHLEKTAILRNFFDKDKKKKSFVENAYIFYKLLLPVSVNRVYNLDGKQLVKVFSNIFDCNADEMSDHLNKGDVSETMKHYFKRSEKVEPASSSVVTCAQVDAYLDELATLSKENEQTKFFQKLVKKFTALDLRMFIRLVKKDVRIDAGSKVILESISPNAYAAYQASRDLKDVITRATQKPGELKKDLSVRINLMTPVKPMLADACKSAEQAFQKCKNGILAEVKYDGERLQVHKNGDKFDYFSRNLKKVSEHKSSYLVEYIPKAFPNAKQLILDGEVLLYDTKKKCPLPFGTLGVHKKNKFQDATVCYYIFDCIYLNGESLMSKGMAERREILEKNVKVIPGRIMLSEQKLITEPQKLKNLMMDAIKNGLEGLVLKDTKSIYEPGKRHWLKMKKDYLESGSMADTADLVVLGAYYGTGNKGGMKSTFLMGCLNEKTKKWHTVTKVANGLDDKTLEKLQKSLDMVEIKKKESAVPNWLVINKTLIPDFVIKNPEKSVVWELTGAEFSKSDKHTADGISIRFPRITKMRDDKSWKEATSLQRLKHLFEVSKQKSDIVDDEEDEEEDEEDEKVSKAKTLVKKESISKRKLVAKSLKKSEDDDDDNDDKVEDSSDEDEKPVNKKLKKTSDNDLSLPSLFKNKTFYIMPNIPKINELKRYILAYDGDVVDVKLIDQANSIVVLDLNDTTPERKNKGEKVEKIVHAKLWELIKKKK